MSSTTDIAAKFADLRSHGLDLGGTAGAEADAGFGGRFQAFQRGRIYWHPQIGTHEVHGGILDEYLRIGGHAFHPVSGARLLGFPKSDEHRTVDDIAQTSEFESGAIYWGYGAGGVPIYGTFYPAWKSEFISLGYPLTEAIPAPAGTQAVYCSFGCLFTSGPAGAVEPLYYRGPRPGRPAIVSTSEVELAGFDTLVLPLPVWDWIQSNDPNHLPDLYKGRLILQAVGGSRAQVPLILETSSVRLLNGGAGVVVELRIKLAPGATLADRTLYDIALLRPNGTAAVMSLHCVYAKSDWNRFGAMHATDIHVTERADAYHRKLASLGRTESLNAYNNYNEAFRDTIRYANKLHDIGLLDIIIATGDLVDYQFEEWQDPKKGWGNFLYFEKIMRGWIPSPTGQPVEELRVPIFTTLGNHDYRQKAYKLLFFANVPVFADPEFEHYQPHNLTKEDAKTLQGGEPTVSSGEALDMVRTISVPEYYKQRLNRIGGDVVGAHSYVVALGPAHRLVMLDSGHDLGVIDSGWDAFKTKIVGIGNEDKKSFADGSPNQNGVTDQHLSLVKTALREAGDGVVIVGIHGPPINIKNGDFAHFFRETEHATANIKDIVGFLIHAKPIEFGATGQFNSTSVVVVGKKIKSINFKACTNIAESGHPGWMNSAGKRFFMHGTVDDLLDEDVSKGRANDFLKMCSGAAVPGHQAGRAADLVLCGHGHSAVEYRVKWTGSELQFFTDFYTENPPFYYATRKVGFDPNALVGVQVKAGAPLNSVPHNRIQDHRFEGDEWTVEVPPYDDPLSATKDPSTWWNDHRPLILQTGAVGPTESRSNSRKEPGKERPSPSFQGFRVLSVAFNTINAIHYVRLDDLRQRHFTMPFEKLEGGLVRLRNVANPDQFIHTQSGQPGVGVIEMGWFSAQWHLERIGSNRFWIRNRWKHDQFLHIQTLKLSGGAIEAGWHSARWILEPLPGKDRYRIRNVWKAARCLNIESGVLVAGPAAPESPSAMWTIE